MYVLYFNYQSIYFLTLACWEIAKEYFLEIHNTIDSWKILMQW